MRVLLVSHRLPPEDLGGVERYTQFLGAELLRTGDQVSMLARRADPGRSGIRVIRERLQGDIPVYRIVGGNLRFDNFEALLDNHERLEQIFTAALLETKPDVVHINHLLCLPPRIIEIAHRLGAAVVVSLHDFYIACPRVHLQKNSGELCQGPDDGRECTRTCFSQAQPEGSLRWGLRTLYFRKLVASAEAIVAYSQYVATFFQSFFGHAKSVHVLENGISFDPAPVDRRPDYSRVPEDRLVLAYCGTIMPHKGPHIILEALAKAALPHVTLWMFGHSPNHSYARQLREAAASIPGLNVRMYGPYEPGELSLLLREVDCVVVPSLVPEAGPIVPREALAEGIPVLAARLGALPELVVEGNNGFTFDPNHPEELAWLLRRLTQDRNLLPRLQGGAIASPRVSITGHASRIRRIYEDALRGFSSADAPWRAGRSEVRFAHESLLQLVSNSQTSKLERRPT